MNIKMIQLSVIDAADRLRSLNPVYVREIARSFEAEGQITPIEVRKADASGIHRLVAGAHRLAASRLLAASGDPKWLTISAAVFAGSNDEARLREIDENLVRNELTALDRARFMAERKAIWLVLHPDTAAGRAGAMVRWHAADNLSFASDAAVKLGVSPKSIDRWIELDIALSWLTDDVRERVAASNLANNQSELKALADIEDQSDREAVIDLLLGGAKGAPKKVAGALAAVRGERVEHETPAEKNFRAFEKLWARCDEPTRRKISEFATSNLKARKGGARAVSK